MKLNRNPRRVKALIATMAAFLWVASASATTYYLRHSEGGSSANAWTTGLDCWTDETPSSSWPASPSKSSSEIGGSAPASISAEDGFAVPVGNGVTLRVQTTAEWNGKDLQLGGVFIRNNSSDRAIARQMLRGANIFTHFKNDGLILAEKGRWIPYYSGNTYNITGIVTVVAASRSAAAEIQPARTAKNAIVVLHDKFKSEVDTYCMVSSATNGLDVTFKDTTEYLGTLTVTNIFDDATAAVTLCTDFPGTLEIGSGATLKTPAGCTINNLSLGDGAVLDASAGAFSVTGAFEVAPGATVIYPTATLQSHDDSSRTKVFDSSMTNASHWSNAAYWPDSATMPGGWHYVLSASSGKRLRTAYEGKIDAPEGDIVFPGLSLTLPASTYLVMLNPSFACTNLVLDGGQIMPSLYVQAVFTGKITVTANGGSIYSYLKTSKFESEIEGSGDLRITGASGTASGTPYGYVRLSGLNTNFTGSITATIPIYTPGNLVTETNKITPRFDRNYMHLQISDKRNLGGPLVAVNPKALTLENMSRLEITEGFTSLTLDEPTRGVFVKWVGRFLSNSGQTMTLVSPLAVYGTMWKEGAGTLVLANPQPTFGADATATMPDGDATNRTLRVVAGTVRIAAGCAVNGLDVVVADGATLALDLASGDADVAAYGIRNERTPGTPFAVDGAAANVYLDLVPPADYEGANDVPVVTVKATDADSVDALLVVRKPTGSGRMRTLAKSRKSVTIDETACVTFTVNTLKHGLVFTIK